VLYNVFKKPAVKAASKCDGCSGCALKDVIAENQSCCAK
jgi:hypothetical protein